VLLRCCARSGTQALTASCSEQERQRCAAAGMAELMAKPVRLDSLRALLQRYTSGARDEA
jgi:CheY-like chemotaxis protein